MTAGVISHRLLPKIADKLEHEILEQKVTAAASEAHAAKVAYKSAVNLNDVLQSASEVLQVASNVADAPAAIERLKLFRSSFPTHRVLHIYLGRLYRRIGDFRSGIIVLREFITNLKADASIKLLADTKLNIADAYFNIACYHALMAVNLQSQGGDADEISRLKSEALEALKLAIKGNKDNEKNAFVDSDLGGIQEDVKKLFGTPPAGGS